MYADTITASMRTTIEETERRRVTQQEYNEKHGITPTQIKRAAMAKMNDSAKQKKKKKDQKYYAGPEQSSIAADPVVKYMSKEDLERSLELTRSKMQKAARDQDFMEAARLRDELFAMQEAMDGKK
jgi:excinuclease ABC subunit B